MTFLLLLILVILLIFLRPILKLLYIEVKVREIKLKELQLLSSKGKELIDKDVC